jgi:hypothetical protein
LRGRVFGDVFRLMTPFPSNTSVFEGKGVCWFHQTHFPSNTSVFEGRGVC